MTNKTRILSLGMLLIFFVALNLFLAPMLFSQLTPGKVLKTAELMEKQGKFDTARKLYLYLITKYPDEIEAYIRMGNLSLQQEKYDDAITYLEKGSKRAEAKKLDYKKGYALLGDVYMKKGVALIKSDKAEATKHLIKAKGNYELAEDEQKLNMLNSVIKRFNLPVAVSSASPSKPKSALGAAKPEGAAAAETEETPAVSPTTAQKEKTLPKEEKIKEAPPLDALGKKILAAAENMYKAGKLDMAQKLYLGFIKRYKERPEGYIGLAKVFMEQQNYDTAIAQLKVGSEKAQAQGLDYKEGYSQLAEAYLKRGTAELETDKQKAAQDFAQAKKYYTLAGQDNRAKTIDLIVKRYSLTLPKVETKPLEKAITKTTAPETAPKVKELTEKPEKPTKQLPSEKKAKKEEVAKPTINKIALAMKYIKLGSIFIERGEFDKAFDRLFKALRVDTTNQYVYYQLGRAYMKMNNPDSAYYYWIKGWEIDKSYLRLAYKLAPYFYTKAETLAQGDVLTALDLAKKALVCYKTLNDTDGIKKSVALVAKLEGLKREYELAQMREKAREKAREALLAKIKSEEQKEELLAKAKKEEETKKPKEKKVIKKQLTYYDYFRLGNRAYKRRKYNTALRYYLKAIELNREYGKAYYNAGCANFYLGKYRAAAKYFKTAYKMLNKDPDALYNLTVSLANDADIVSAMYYAEMYVRILQ